MSVASDRLAASYYNSNPVSGSNPGGMDDGGHVQNFPLALKDVGTVGNEIVADNAATKAAIEAHNDATAELVDGYAASAFASKNAAGEFEDQAGAAAASAITSANAAFRVVAANFPDRIDPAAIFFSEALTGDPATVASIPGGKIVNAAGFGPVYRATGAANLAHKGVATAAAEFIIEIAVEVEQVSAGAGETPAARIRLQGLDRDYASTGANAAGPLVPTPVGVTTIVRRFAYTPPTGGTAWPQPGTAVWLRPVVEFNRKADDSGAAAASVAQVRRMSIRDVTAVVAAEVAAAAAAASASSLTYASRAEALAATAADRIMSPLEVKAAIDKFTPFPVGTFAQFQAPPGTPWLAKDGRSYLQATYPALAAVLGAKFAPAPTVTTGQGAAAVGLQGLLSVIYLQATGEYFIIGPVSGGQTSLGKKARAGGTNASPVWSGAMYGLIGAVAGNFSAAQLAAGAVGAHTVIAFTTPYAVGFWNVSTSAMWSTAAGVSSNTGRKLAIAKGLVVARTDNTIGVATAATANSQMVFTARAAVPNEGASYGGLGVEFSAPLNAFVSCTNGSTTIVISTDAAAAVWTATAVPAPVEVKDFCVTSTGHVFVLGASNDLWVSADLANWRKIGRFPGAAGTATQLRSAGGLGLGSSNLGYLFDQFGINTDQTHTDPTGRQAVWDGRGLIEVTQYTEVYRSFPIDLTTQFCVGEVNPNSPLGYWKAA